MYVCNNRLHDFCRRPSVVSPARSAAARQEQAASITATATARACPDPDGQSMITCKRIPPPVGRLACFRTY